MYIFASNHTETGIKNDSNTYSYIAAAFIGCPIVCFIFYCYRKHKEKDLHNKILNEDFFYGFAEEGFNRCIDQFNKQTPEQYTLNVAKTQFYDPISGSEDPKNIWQETWKEGKNVSNDSSFDNSMKLINNIRNNDKILLKTQRTPKKQLLKPSKNHIPNDYKNAVLRCQEYDDLKFR